LFLIVYAEGKINGFRSSIGIDLFGAHDSIYNWAYRAALPPLIGIDGGEGLRLATVEKAWPTQN
jgi:hypothetical protein